MVSMHQPLSCLPKRMYMATTQICGCVETTVLSIERLSPDKYAMPTHEEIFDVVGHVRVFTTLDLQVGYHQLPI
jgi:hypothetical protein